MGIDTTYQQLLADLLQRGERVTTRNAPVRRLFNRTFTIAETPLVTTRRTAWKNCLREWEWFMTGSIELDDLHPDVRSWWEPFAKKDPAYPKYSLILPGNYSEMFRDFGNNFDQIDYLVDGVRNHPYSRRNVITTWHTEIMASGDCNPTNCHGTVIQAFVDTTNKLHLTCYQRSTDVVCGLPHNWLQYWAFLLWLAHRGERDVGSLFWIGGDIHLYDVHTDLAGRIVAATPQANPPQLHYAPTGDEFKADDFWLDTYEPAFTERAEMVV